MYKGLKGGGEPIEKKEVKIDNTIRSAWNNYVGWLDKKGLKGHPSLDKEDFGGKMIDKYRAEMPDTPISRDMVIPIQKEFNNYRNWSLGRIKSGVANFGDGVSEENFMPGLSTADGIAGQRTTSYSFPREYMRTFDEDNNLESVEDKGFAKSNKK